MFQAFGPIKNPLLPLTNNAAAYQGTNGEGLIFLFSNLTKLAVVIAGLYALINFILAGYGFMGSGGDPKVLQKAQEKITRSILGLIVIAASYLFAGIIGFVIFGSTNWDILINPRLFTP